MKTIIKKILIFLFFAGYIFAQNDGDFIEAFELYRTNHFAEARESFLNITTKNNIDDDLMVSSKYYAADCLLKLGLLNGTISEFEYFVSKYSFSNLRVKALYKLGTTYFELEDYPNVREKFFIIINEYPKFENMGLVYYWLGKSYVKENRFIEAEKFLLESVSIDRYGDRIDYTIYSLAHIYELQGRYNDAVTYYDELLAFHPNSTLLPSAQLRIGISYFNLNEYDRAILELSDSLIQKLPEKKITEAGYLLANSYFRLGQYENAENAFRKVLKRSSIGDIERELKFSIAWVNFQQQNYEEAYKQFLELTKKGEQDSISIKSLFWSGESKRYLGELQYAEKIFKTFLTDLEQNPFTDAVRLSLGIIQFNRENFKEASRNLIIASNSTNNIYRARALILLGEISLRLGNYKDAENYFGKGVKIELPPGDVSNRAILGLGVAQFHLQKYENASMNLTDLTMRVKDFEKRKANFYLAETHFAMGDFQKAQQHFYRVGMGDSYIEKSALYGMAYSYFNLKDFGNAAFYFKEYLKRDKNSKNFSDAKLRLADSYFGMKNFVLANDVYKEFFAKHSNHSNIEFAMFQYGQSLFKSNNNKLAIDKLNLLLKRFPNSKFSDDSRYLIGWIHFQKNNFDLAINNYRKLITDFPKSPIVPIAYYSIGDSFFNMGEFDSAIVYYLKIIDKYPKTRFVYDAMNGIQFSYLALDKPNEAVELINSFIVRFPNLEYSDRILIKKGEIHFSYGNYEKAISGYSELINFFPNSELVPEALYWIGKSHIILDKIIIAKEYFREIINKHITSNYGIEAIVELGKIYSSKKDFENEIALYQSTLPKIINSPKAEEILFLQGIAFINANKKDEAYKSFNEIIKYYDKTLFSDKAKIEIGILEIENGRAFNSEQLFSEVAINRNDDIGAKAQYFLGVARYQQEKYDEAISALVRVRTLFAIYDEWFTKSLLKLGDSYLKLNDKANARKMYRAVIKKHPGNEFGKEARAKLKRIK